MMRWNPMATCGLAIIVAPAFLAGPAGAGTITPIEQDRTLDAFVIVPQCFGKDFEQDGAPGFEDFVSEVEASLECGEALGAATAAQDSRIGEAALVAAGRAASEASAERREVIHAIASSRFVVTFEIAAACAFDLAGLITAEASPEPGVDGGASVMLLGPGNVEIFEHEVRPGPDGERRSRHLDSAGELDAGVYTLRAFAGSIIDQDVPPDGSAEGTYDLAFVLSAPCPADLDGSGDVGFADVLAVLAAWGACDEDCPEDLDLSGDVGFGDLLIVLAAWGPCASHD